MSPEQRKRIYSFDVIDMIDLLYQAVFDYGEDVSNFFYTGRDDWDGRAPIDLILAGDIIPVAELVNRLVEGEDA